MKVVQKLFEKVGAKDFLKFKFGGKTYQQQLDAAMDKTKKICAVTVEVREIDIGGDPVRIVWMDHDFGFLGGSLGCAEGEKLCRGFEYGKEHRMPVVVSCRSGGARMQEGTLSLMQMAKVSVAVQSLKAAKLPYISVLHDPTFGGVSASYAMEADVKIGLSGARIGFAGPAVILNTVFEQDQNKYDRACPAGFQSAEYLQDHGQLDIVVEDKPSLESVLSRVVNLLHIVPSKPVSQQAVTPIPNSPTTPAENDYTLARNMDRYQTQDIVQTVFRDYQELQGDGRVANDVCIRGGLALLDERAVMVIATVKGHTPSAMAAANYGMAAPSGYRIALRLMELAEHFNLPIVTLVDTPGAYPSFAAEESGQSEAIATNLTRMASLRVPLVSLVVGEGGSGGALGLCVANSLGMLSRAWFSVISPEGAASVLGRYKDAEDKKKRFADDCRSLANVQNVYASQLKDLGVIDTIVPEEAGNTENYNSFPTTAARIKEFFVSSLNHFCGYTPDQLVQQRYTKYRSLGYYDELSAETVKSVFDKLEQQTLVSSPITPLTPKPVFKDTEMDTQKLTAWGQKILSYIAETTVNGPNSAFRDLHPRCYTLEPPIPPPCTKSANKSRTAKHILDEEGPDAVVQWLRQQKRVLVTDTTMRDAHQSLLATRVRTHDMMSIAAQTNELLRDSFSLECWGGATFDVCYRFLYEDPWERLRELRKAIPDVMFQMLVRGSNAVGYTNYADNVVEAFIEKAAAAGMDVFRIFDCFNDVRQMKTCIAAVRKANKIAEACICFTGNFLSPDEKIYTLDYFKQVCREVVDAGAHMIAVKDMAGLLRPQMAAPLMAALREVTDLPIHFHTHNTSSAALTTVINMATSGCSVVDCAIASMSDTTSQPSLNAFLAATEGSNIDAGINYLSLEPLDMYWANVRELYAPFEAGLKSGTARVYDHQIPGGQYSNLLAQCKDLGIWHQWEDVLNMYRDVNHLFGDIVKVTPSSKCVGDMALFLISKGASVSDVLGRSDFSYPKSVIDLMKGDLGVPHRGFPADVQKAILKSEKPLTCLPNELLPPVDFAVERDRLAKAYPFREVSDEDVVSSVLYPKVFSDYMDHISKHTESLTHVPSGPFFYGMTVGQTVQLELPPSQLSLETTGSGSTSVSVTLTRVGALKRNNSRTLTFTVNGTPVSLDVHDEAAASKAGAISGLMADPANPNQIGSPLQGQIEKVLVEAGQSVAAGDVIAVVSAMKIEVAVQAPVAATVASISVKTGQKVDSGSLMAVLTPA